MQILLAVPLPPAAGRGLEVKSLRAHCGRMTLVLYRRRAFRKKCERARCSGALSIKPLEGSRPWLRRTRALCKFNCGKVRCRDAPKLYGRARQTTAGAE